MRIMLTGSEAGAVDTVGRGLNAAGHEVVNVLELPVDLPPRAAAFDVALCVRAHPLPRLTRHEACLQTVLESGTPFVIAGAGAAHPLLDQADELVGELDPAVIADVMEHAVARRVRLCVAATVGSDC